MVITNEMVWTKFNLEFDLRLNLYYQIKSNM